jgi:ubiquinone/menaquinone biosynthesis C-methylase UbiE
MRQAASLLPAFPEKADIETSSDDYALRFSGAIGTWFLQVQEEATLAMLAPHRGASVLDVGGGHGQLTSGLVQNGYRVTILGSSDTCKVRVQKFIDGKRCSFNVGNLLELPYPNQSFDIVLSYRLLPHVTHWKRLIGELSRVARNAVIIDYPSVRSVNCLTPLFFRLKRHLEGDTRCFTSFRESDLLEVFESFGFKGADRHAEFLLPMVLHRIMKAPKLSSALEKALRLSGATRVFGSPVILKVLRV